MELRHRFITSIVLILLVISNSYATNPDYDNNCPVNCICNNTINHAKCTSLSGLIRTTRTDLESLDLSQSSLRRITSHLERFQSLTKLNISYNRLSEVNKLPKSIQELDLSHNRITSAKLSKIPKSVEKLNLTHNHITYIPLSLRTLKKLKVLELGNNPINCTCEALAVRNWIKERHVWTDTIICSAPLEYKGQPWLSVKQVDVCELKVDNLTAASPVIASASTGSKYNWDEIEKDNEVMLGDQPAEGSGAGDDEDEDLIDDYDNDDGDEDEDYDFGTPKTGAVVEKPIENEEEDDGDEDKIEEEQFITVKSQIASSQDADPEDDDIITPKTEPLLDALDEDTGSGDDAVPPVPAIHAEGSGSSSPAPDTTTEDDEYDDDDDSSGTPVVGVLLPEDSQPSSTQSPESDLYYPPEDAVEEVSSSTPAPTLGTLGIFGAGIDVTTPGSDESANDNESGAVPVPKDSVGDDAETVAPPVDGDKSDVKQAKTDDNTNTFILLGILGVLLVGLMIYVTMKDKKDKRNRKGARDIENTPATELQDMVKKNPNTPNGKPESTPLMTNGDGPENNKPNGKDKPYPSVSPNRIDEEEPEEPPHLQTFKPNQNQVPANNIPNGNHIDNNNTTEYPTQNGDLADVHKTPTKPDEDTTQLPNQPKRYSPVYSPRTPKLDRYSPVYTPEGRVKIKLTETPKPKTPIMVSRTRSRAGDYTITPEVIIDSVPSNNKEAATH